MLHNPCTAICTICYLLLSCGHKSLLSRRLTAVTCDHKTTTDNKLYKLW